jgi:phosphoglycolate phosphatase
MTYRLVLFDFDGVLADSAGWFAAQLPDMARRHRFRAPDEAQITHLRRLPTREVMRALGVSPLRLPAMAADLRRRMAADADQIAMFEGAPQMLRRLADQGVRLAVVSSNSEANVRAVLGDHAALIAAFSCGASLLGKAKRFSALLKAFEVAPDQACAVGDELRDIEAAHLAKIAAMAVTWGFGDAGALIAAGPRHVATTPDEAAGLLLGGAQAA